MISLLKRMRPAAFGPGKDGHPLHAAPDVRTYLIGDVHGCLALLDTMLAGVDSDLAKHPAQRAHLVLLGDYIDHGNQSAEVLARLRDLDAHAPLHTTILMGSHEKMLLDFLDRPRTHGLRWLRNGGLGTLAAFGLRGLTVNAMPEDLEVAASQLRPRLAPGLIDWLRHRPLRWDSGNVTGVHAGLDPGKPVTEQRDQVLLWGHGRSLTHDRADGHWVVHGHTEVETPEIQGTRINIDTNPVVSGLLTAVVLDPAAPPRFLQAHP